MENNKEEDINEVDFEEVESEELVESHKYSDKELAALKQFASILAEILIPSITKKIFDALPSNKNKGKIKAEKKKTMEENKVDLVKSLVESGIDFKKFDCLITNEINRRLKIRFSIIFLIFTFVVTAASFMIVIFDGIYSWNISQVAIIALIIEIPIQFIGILYIIAKNLFPKANNK